MTRKDFRTLDQKARDEMLALSLEEYKGHLAYIQLELQKDINLLRLVGCRRCGCTEDNACIDDRVDEACHWVEEDLCSACATEREVSRK